jgi:hypothetical protein
MAISLDALLYAIKMIESSGRYGVVNSAGAYGAYQVMRGNIASWTQEALGRSYSPQQFLNDPAAQDAVARYKLGQYMQRFGSAEAAAAVWFSGKPDIYSTASDGSTTVRQYVQRMQNYAAAFNNAGSSGSTGGGALTTPVQPKLDDRTLASTYGLSYEEIQANKELKGLFKQAVKQGWSSDVFTAHLKNTNWWRTTSDTQRQYFDLRFGDPATFNQKWGSFAFQANQAAVAAGLGSLLGKGSAYGHMDSTLQDATYKLFALGWSTDRLQDYLAAKAKIHNGIMLGAAGDAFDKLHALAWENGLQLSSAWYQKNAVAVASGTSTIGDQERNIRRTAAARYKPFATQILAGQNVMDLASPYIKTVSNLLEIPDSSVDLRNKYVAKAMTSMSQDGKSPYALWQLEDDVRQDPLWRKTKNAQDSAMAVAHGVLQNFGMAF